MTTQQINQKVEELLANRNKEVVFGVFEAFKDEHVRGASNSECGCVYCGLAKEHLRFKHLDFYFHRAAKRNRPDLEHLGERLDFYGDWRSLRAEMQQIEAEMSLQKNR